jgi:hypothetical protein
MNSGEDRENHYRELSGAPSRGVEGDFDGEFTLYDVDVDVNRCGGREARSRTMKGNSVIAEIGDYDDPDDWDLNPRYFSVNDDYLIVPLEMEEGGKDSLGSSGT